MHSGGAMSGHYFAFIKAFNSGRWYCFNDSNVTGIDPTEIPKRAFGG
jgi:ubiquitin carboxyl-terminal hydrolase 47